MAKLQLAFAIVILVLFAGLHIFAAAQPKFSVPGPVDEVMLLATGALFAPYLLNKWRNGNGSR